MKKKNFVIGSLALLCALLFLPGILNNALAAGKYKD